VIVFCMRPFNSIVSNSHLFAYITHPIVLCSCCLFGIGIKVKEPKLMSVSCMTSGMAVVLGQYNCKESVSFTAISCASVEILCLFAKSLDVLSFCQYST
jgi:hypothetical protein